MAESVEKIKLLIVDFLGMVQIVSVISSCVGAKVVGTVFEWKTYSECNGHRCGSWLPFESRQS